MFPVASFTASRGHDELIDVFAVAYDPDSEGGTVWQARQNSFGGWTAWMAAGTPGVGAVDVRSVLDAEGRGHVLALAGRGAVWFNERDPKDEFSGWLPLGRPATDWMIMDASGTTRLDGRIDVIATADNVKEPSLARAVWRRSSSLPLTSWGSWRSLGNNTFIGDVTAAVARDDSLNIFTPASTDALEPRVVDISHRRRTPDGTWTDWAVFGRPPGGLRDDVRPVVVANSDGRLEMFVVSVAGAVWHRWQKPNGWSAWASLGDADREVTGIAAAADAAGRLELSATLSDHTIARRRQGTSGRPWSEWANLGNPVTGLVADPVLVLDAQGCLLLLLRQPEWDGIVTLREETPGGPWVTGPALPSPPP
jgi:hypothetical protein